MRNLFRRLLAGGCMLALCLTSASALEVGQALSLLEEHYVDALPPAAYEAETLDALFEAVGDPYTYYMTASDYDAFTSSVERENVVNGVGLGIEYTANGLLVTLLLDGGGAKDAGLRVGDTILAVDGVSCVPALEAHRALIIGDVGTFVTLTVRHADGAVEDYRIERRSVSVHNTLVSLADGVGQIDCNSFGSQTKQYIVDGVGELDGQASHWVVDLRGNLGGIADAAVAALGVFTGAGPKLFYRLADGSSLRTFFLGSALTDKPVVVLVDPYSASASEIFAGGIRAEGCGIVVGTRTYGKGTAQIVLNQTQYPALFDGDSLKVTAYRFYCSDGSTTDRIGVIPTLLIPAEYTGRVAALLQAEAPKSGEYLSFPLNGHEYYVDLPAARKNEAALSALFSALPPDLLVSHTSGGEVVSRLDAADAAKRLGVVYADRRFTDSADSPYAAQIDTLAVYGVLSGDGTGSFRPDATLTRAELAAMLAHALHTAKPSHAGFHDVPAESWYADAVDSVAGLSLMGGVGGGRFDPSGTLTQEQFIAVMGRFVRFLNFQADEYAASLPAGSADDGALAALHDWARTEARVLTGYAGNMLYTELAAIEPNAPVTRGQAAATLCNMLKTLRILSY